MAHLKNLRERHQWGEFKKQYSSIQLNRRDREKEADALIEKEEIIRNLLSKYEGQSFLEVGMGPYPNLERMRLIAEKNITYSGCDLEDVCKIHKDQLNAVNLWSSKIHFIPNKVGTYSWSLFEMMENGEKFDLIYIDGHHTFYIDLPAFVIADHLLEPDGSILIDDIDFTMVSLLQDMAYNFNIWSFYRLMYDFHQYENEQQRIPHIRKIVENFMIPRLGYNLIKLSENSFVELRLLKKP